MDWGEKVTRGLRFPDVKAQLKASSTIGKSLGLANDVEVKFSGSLDIGHKVLVQCSEWLK